jgi:hypothetical protein
MVLPALKPGTRALLVERNSNLPVLTESRLGAGRAMLLGLNEAWRWRPALAAQGYAQQRAHDRFWLSLVRYAAGEPYAASDEVLALDVDRLRVEPAQPVRVRARIKDRRAMEDESPGQVPGIQLMRHDTLMQGQSLGYAGRAEMLLQDLEIGQYTVRLSVGQRSLSLPLQVATSDEAEMKDVSADVAELRRIVGPRGEVIEFADLPTLPQRLARLIDETEPSAVELRLWDSPYLFLFVLGCLGVEWALRKRVGLV